MTEVPGAGDTFNAVADERMARELVEERKQQAKDADTLGVAKKVTLDDLFARIQQGEMKDFNIIVKADVQGSAEAVKTSLEKLSNDEVRVQRHPLRRRRDHRSRTSCWPPPPNAIIVGFNVRPDNAARDYAASGERRDAHVPRHLRLHKRDRGRHEGHAGPEVRGAGHRPRRDPPDSTRSARSAPSAAATSLDGKVAARLQGPRRARRHRHVRGRDGLPAPLQGRRQGSRRRLRVRHPDRKVQRRARAATSSKPTS